MTNVYTVTDLLNAAAEALRQGDLIELEDLQNLVRGWAQLPEETEAQVNMLEAMMGEVE